MKINEYFDTIKLMKSNSQLIGKSESKLLFTLDPVMPGMDGFKVCQNISNDPRTKNIKIISIMAYDTPEYKEKIINSEKIIEDTISF